MLYLTRKTGETVVINDTIEVTVVEVRGRSVKLGFTFPASASVLRKEIHDKVKQENLAAAQSGDSLDDVSIDPSDLDGLRRSQES